MGFTCCRYNTKKIADALGVSEKALDDAMKANSYGGFAWVWQVENKGNYSTARVTVSRKEKDSEVYTTDFQDGFVRLVGQAHTVFQGMKIEENKAIPIKISNCEVTNVYTAPDGKVSYTPHFTIFGLEIQDFESNTNNKRNNASSAKTNSGSDEEFLDIPEGVDEDLPFS